MEAEHESYFVASISFKKILIYFVSHGIYSNFNRLRRIDVLAF
jgi:hypothetical protein